MDKNFEWGLDPNTTYEQFFKIQYASRAFELSSFNNELNGQIINDILESGNNLCTNFNKSFALSFLNDLIINCANFLDYVQIKLVILLQLIYIK